ncbi:MAG: hypothetical protein ABIK68_06540 [bacterium]
MSVKILISRTVAKDLISVVKPFLAELHALAWRSKGYISGEALINKDNPEERIVISSWQSVENWENFQNLEECKQLHFKVDQILGQVSKFTVYLNT